MKMVWAVIRSSKVEAVGRALKDIEIRGCTVFPVRGYGEEWRVYEPLIHGGHHKVEVIVEDDKADRVMQEILEHSFTGLEGDGILSVFNLEAAVKIRSKDMLTETESPSGLGKREHESEITVLMAAPK